MRQQLTVNLAAGTGRFWWRERRALRAERRRRARRRPAGAAACQDHRAEAAWRPAASRRRRGQDRARILRRGRRVDWNLYAGYLHGLAVRRQRDRRLPDKDKVDCRVFCRRQNGRFAFVPFNEPDWIWYDLKTTKRAQYVINRNRFLTDWTAACRTIRSANPDALIIGPNEAYYDSRFMPDFLSYAKAGDVLPDIISWHELSPSSLRTYRSSYASFRALEKQLGIPPLPININEYGNRRDLSNPGQLVQWIVMFEDTKVYANQAYWDIAGNYADNAVQNNMPNGSWWLLRWYGAMTGNTVSVVPPAPDTIDTLCGLASLDTGKRQARVIVANPAGGNARIALTGIDRRVFGERVRVLLASTTWTGYDGVASTPLELAEAEYPVVNGQVTVDLDAMDPMIAYQLTMSPAIGAPPSAITPPWIAQCHAADATLTGCTDVYSQGSRSNSTGTPLRAARTSAPSTSRAAGWPSSQRPAHRPLPAVGLLREPDGRHRPADHAGRFNLVVHQLPADAQLGLQVAPGPVPEPGRRIARRSRSACPIPISVPPRARSP